VDGVAADGLVRVVAEAAVLCLDSDVRSVAVVDFFTGVRDVERPLVPAAVAEVPAARGLLVKVVLLDRLGHADQEAQQHEANQLPSSCFRHCQKVQGGDTQRRLRDTKPVLAVPVFWSGLAYCLLSIPTD
jgi:hypothetical protein